MILIRNTDIMELYGVQSSQASRIMARVRSALGKKTKAPVTIKEFASAEDLNEEEIKTALKRK